MKKLTSVAEFNTMKQSGKHLFFFTADWCGDCTFIKPVMPEIEAAHPEFTFVEVDRDEFIDLCGELFIMGIPSFVVFEEGQELGRFVNKDRKTQEEIEAFITGL
ncbi:thioredoxin family protein [Carnobacterium gallinarum]|uniref:thioredoxin family protein n=1 Tax=Carnobacterium gallinarum TaxID=2749 RepID=UPI00054F93DF|nr:thioredoxin family protein [Carnobacterium gallinarum]